MLVPILSEAIMKKLPMFQVDAFTDTVFKGNPAAVVLLEDEWLPEEQMQKIAFENNLSETAFIKSLEDEGRFAIRWFTPLLEVPLCGHATLASSFVLFSIHKDLERIVFETMQVGELIISRGESGGIVMDFPNRKPTEIIDLVPEALLKGLRSTPTKVLRNQQAYFVVYDDEHKVREESPDLSELIKLSPFCVTVTAISSTSEYDFVSRFFAADHGVPEDPVTGSVHAGLAPYWAEVLGKERLAAYQASARGGQLVCTVKGDRVLIEGQAVLFFGGFVYI